MVNRPSARTWEYRSFCERLTYWLFFQKVRSYFYPNSSDLSSRGCSPLLSLSGAKKLISESFPEIKFLFRKSGCVGVKFRKYFPFHVAKLQHKNFFKILRDQHMLKYPPPPGCFAPAIRAHLIMHSSYLERQWSVHIGSCRHAMIV